MSRIRSSRREVLRTLGMAGAATLVDPGPWLARTAAQAPCATGEAGTLIETLPLFRGRSQAQPFGVKFGPGLDARRITDLSLLEPDNLITPNGLGYIRTEIPPLAMGHRARGWSVDVTGLADRDRTFAIADLTSRATPQGAHLFECSGNANPSNFGLMSVAEWRGVPIAEFLDPMKPAAGATAILVDGWDHEVSVSGRSVPGASWVFPLEWVKTSGAFLATSMNGEALSDDHGAPLRLVNPGWYGCSWIKWVHEIRFVGSDEPATSQMIEFANRTHQKAPHKLAREYSPADIQTAATPVRVEKRKTDTGLAYRIVGIVWGGQEPVDRLSIRFGPEDTWKRFAICPRPKTHKTWALWEYLWKPAAPGTYSIALKADPSIPQRRLDSGYYVRQVKIDEI